LAIKDDPPQSQFTNPVTEENRSVY